MPADAWCRDPASFARKDPPASLEDLVVSDACHSRLALVLDDIRFRRKLRDFLIVTSRSPPASERLSWRADHVIEFPFPDEWLRAEIWKRSIPPEMPHRPEIDWAALAARPLSGDAIRRAVKHAALYAARDDRAVSMDHFRQAIQMEDGTAQP